MFFDQIPPKKTKNPALKQQHIYEVQVATPEALKSILNKPDTYSYFSNLKKCFECLSNTLLLQGYSHSINYTAIYRSILAKNKYQFDLAVAGQKLLRVSIIRKTINPNLSLLGIDKNPMQRYE
jgi:hypothetical protein